MTMLEVERPATRSEIGEWPDLRDRETREQLTPSAVRAVDRLAAQWGLTVAEVTQLLGGISESSWFSWQRSAPAALTTDQLTRVSLLLGIYTALAALHEGSLATEWVRRPNTNAMFGGRAPLDAMLAGGIPVMIEVRALLDGRRGGL